MYRSTEPEAVQTYLRGQEAVTQTEQEVLYDPLRTDQAPAHLFKEPGQAATIINHQAEADLPAQITETDNSAAHVKFTLITIFSFTL